MYKFLFSLSLSLCILTLSHGQDQKSPSFEEVLSLQGVSGATISPNGKHVVFSKSAVDWKENRYDRELWLSKDGGEPFQLTNNPKGNSNGPIWSPDSKWIAFIAAHGDKSQIRAIRVDGGTSFQVTHRENGINGFEWSPDGKQLAFLQSIDKTKANKERKEKFGGYAVEDEEYNLNQLWVADFNPNQFYKMPLPDQMKDTTLTKASKARLLIDNTDFTITSYLWSPDGKKIAYGHKPDPLRNNFYKSDISIFDIETKSHKLLVNNPSSDGLEDWSPDSKSILYGSSLDDKTSNYYKNDKLFRIDIDGSNNKQLAKDFDENMFGMNWTDQGIYAIAWQKTDRPLIKVNPNTGSTTIINTNGRRIWNYWLSDNNQRMAYSASGDDDLSEIYISGSELQNPKQLTNSTNQIDNWLVSDSEVISWKSKDGATIEGVLHKPKNYDPNKKYPLLVAIHGGPTGISRPAPTHAYVYPINQWLNKGALVLQPNYRGSAGYGEAFRSLNVKNLGVGDAWDVLSGVDYLEKLGIIDGDKVGSMGWSQGGYISAFLTTNSNKFKAISVGAGISNWMTYYVNTDIHPFTRQYLKATPWSDKGIYEKTSPMTNINKATTPTLIQHGEFDRRVPTANGYELFQGLQDVGVDTKLIIYKGFGHGITKPKERLAAMWHNWQWFGKYIWGEDIEIPMK